MSCENEVSDANQQGTYQSGPSQPLRPPGIIHSCGGKIAGMTGLGQGKGYLGTFQCPPVSVQYVKTEPLFSVGYFNVKPLTKRQFKEKLPQGMVHDRHCIIIVFL
jgi:hypothetical protein